MYVYVHVQYSMYVAYPCGAGKAVAYNAEEDDPSRYKYYPVLGVLWHHHHYTLPQETAPPPLSGQNIIHTYIYARDRQAGKLGSSFPRFPPRKQSKAGKLAECGVTLVTVLYCLKHADDFPVFLKESSLFGCKVIRVSE